MTVRTVVVWCPDWPVQAGHVGGPVAVVHANRVVVASAAARAEGVRVGQRRRQAEAVCPGLVTVSHDPDRDARAFEPVVTAVAAFCPTVEVIRPGLCAFSARGPARYFGGEESLVRQVTDAVDTAVITATATGAVGTTLPPATGAPAAGGAGPVITGSVTRCRIGVADGPFAAALAARRGLIVPPGATAEFLAPLPVKVLERPELADLLERLGVRTLGELAALPAPQVLSRFGWEGAAVHRLSRGLDERPLDARRPPEDLSVQDELDPPVDRVDMAAFIAKALADRLHESLARGGWRATRVRIEAESEHGESLSRAWRHDGTFSAAALAERVRWQLDGWLTSPQRPTAGLTRLRLVPDEVVADHGVQQGFWGGLAEADQRAGRALARVQGMLGPEGVLTAVLDGGRSPAERSTLVPWGDERSPRRRPELPWPGRVPPPSPARAWPGPTSSTANKATFSDLTDSTGRTVVVNGRGEPSAAPERLSVDGADWMKVTAWSAPWPCQERWWDPLSRRRRALMQVATDDGRAFLLSAEGGRWSVEAEYD